MKAIDCQLFSKLFLDKQLFNFNLFEISSNHSKKLSIQNPIISNEDLDKITSCIKLTGYVNSDNNFTNQADVLNSASELLTKVFGNSGIHARAAISVNSLPLGAAVEIESN